MKLPCEQSLQVENEPDYRPRAVSLPAPSRVGSRSAGGNLRSVSKSSIKGLSRWPPSGPSARDRRNCVGELVRRVPRQPNRAIGDDKITQFGPALHALNIDIMRANSSLAKRRIERIGLARVCAGGAQKRASRPRTPRFEVLKQSFQPKEAEGGDSRDVLDFALADHPLNL